MRTVAGRPIEACLLDLFRHLGIEQADIAAGGPPPLMDWHSLATPPPGTGRVPDTDLSPHPGYRTTANFAVWHFQRDATDVYVGRYTNVLVRGPAGLLFRERRVILDLETLRPHGKLSFIL